VRRREDKRIRVAGWLTAVVAAVLALTACASSDGERTVTVFAAASLTEAFNEMARAFEQRNEGVTVRLSYQASSTLRIQLEQGAKADVYASADEFNMDLAASADVISGDPVVFARNRLAVIVPRDAFEVRGLADLASPGLRVVAGDDATPFGRYTNTAFDRLAADPDFGPAFRDAAVGNIVSKEANVRRAVAKVEIGEADAALAYVTDTGGAGRSDLEAIPIPERYSGPIRYPIGVVRGAAAPGLAADFITFVLSEEGRAVLLRYGFVPPDGGAWGSGVLLRPGFLPPEGSG